MNWEERIEIEKQEQFLEQSVPILSQIEGQEIETAHKSFVFPCFRHRTSPAGVGRMLRPDRLKRTVL